MNNPIGIEIESKKHKQSFTIFPKVKKVTLNEQTNTYRVVFSLTVNIFTKDFEGEIDADTYNEKVMGINEFFRDFTISLFIMTDELQDDIMDWLLNDIEPYLKCTNN